MGNKKYIYIGIAALAALVISFLVGSRHGYNKAVEGIESKTDTVTRVVPVYKDFPDPVASAAAGFIHIPTYAFITDTVTNEHYVNVHDTTTQYIYLPREQKYYEEDDGRLRLWVSGYEPRLDRYELDKVETYITNTVTVPPPKFVLGVEGGFGAMFPNKNVSYFPYIELDASYAITKHWSIGVSGGYEAPITGGKIMPYPYVRIRGSFSIISF